MRQPELVNRLRRVLGRHPEVLEAYLFGSVARDEGGALSDVDVAVYLDQPRIEELGCDHAAQLLAELMSELGSDHVDLVVLNEAGPLLYHRVLRDGVRLLARDLKRTTTREGQALSRYCDFVPQLVKIHAAHARRIKSGSFGR